MKIVNEAVAHDRIETFHVSPDEKRQLIESMAQADRGEFVDGETLLSELNEAD
jgi:hypothetical protein